MLLRPLPVLLALTCAALAVLAARPLAPQVVHCLKGRVAAPLPAEAGTLVGRASVPSSAPPIRHSRPGASRVIYLDFTGETVSGTFWNDYADVTSWNCLPYNRAGTSPTTFSNAEQADIVRIWERVSEDFAPFAVDVTTEAPADRISAASTTTAWVLITAEQDAANVALPHQDAGGVAILDCFGEAGNAFYAPAWVNGTMEPEDIADAASHEVGHNLGLDHDGAGTDEYYLGHAGAGVPSWGPIMGAPYGMAISQWSRGQYLDASNTENDLAIIAGKLVYTADDHGDDTAGATTVALDASSTLAAAGTIGLTGDVDVFRVEVPSTGDLSVAVAGYRDTAIQGNTGGNLDLSIAILDGDGAVLASANSASSGDALTFTPVSSGTYYLRVTPVGAGTPLADPPSGYTAYGTLGEYTLSGSLTTTAPVVSDSSASGTVGASLSVDLDAVGAQGFSATGLPPGLSISGIPGRISGIPSTAGSFSTAVTAINGSGSDSATISFTIASLPLPAVNDGSASAIVGTGFYRTVSSVRVSGYSAAGLPAGLSISSTSGVISGTPLIAGTFAATITGTNDSGSDTGIYTITVSPAPAPPSAAGSEGSGGDRCGSGSGIAVLLGLFALAFIRRR